MTTHEILLAAQAAKLPLALADTDTKNAALEAWQLPGGKQRCNSGRQQAGSGRRTRAHQRCNAGPSCPDPCPAGRHGQGHA